MRKTLGLLVLVLGGVLSVSAQDRELIYSSNPQYPPYHWAENEVALAGASVELLKLILPPEVRTRALVVPWKRVLDLASTGQIDLVLSLRITPERSQYLTFVAHRAFPNPVSVFVRKDSAFQLTSWEVLKGRLGGVSAGDYFGGGFDEYWRANLQVETADSMVENFRKLDAGRIDWFVTGRYPGLSYLSTHPPAHPIVALDPVISNEGIHFGFSSRSPWVKLIPGINQRLEELDRAGVLEALVKRYTSGVTPVPPGRYPGE